MNYTELKSMTTAELKAREDKVRTALWWLDMADHFTPQERAQHDTLQTELLDLLHLLHERGAA